MVSSVVTPGVVSVVMAVRNGQAYLVDAIDSILSQTYSDFEFIIVDDGSTDSTSSILEQYKRQDQRVRVLYRRQSGLVSSLNAGCAEARGVYIARMDADDVSVASRLANQIDFLTSNPDIALVGSAFTLTNDAGETGEIFFKPTRHSEIEKELLNGNNAFLHPSVVMRRDAFEAVGGYRQSFVHAEDYDLWLRFVERYKTANLNDSLLHYRIHDQQVTLAHLRQGIYSLLGSLALFADKEKFQSTSPLSGEIVSGDTLRKLGVPADSVDRAVAVACFWQGSMQLQAGYRSQAKALLLASVKDARGGVIRRWLGQWLVRLYVLASKISSQPIRKLAMHALLPLTVGCISPVEGWRLVKGKVQRLDDRLRG